MKYNARDIKRTTPSLFDVENDQTHPLTTHLLEWYDEHKRDLPWRHTDDPYAIWISETILQQTRIEQGLDYYYRFMSTFPTYQDLAMATEDEVMKLWQGLGYYSRARNLHAAAKSIGDSFPTTYDEVIKLKGVGPYTAAAICSFAYGLPHAVLDGNVYRVLGRYLGIPEEIETSKGKKIYSQAANYLLSKSRPADFNQAIMDFGAIHCSQHSPKCDSCPLIDGCYAHSVGQIADFPVKKKKLALKHRYLYYIAIEKQHYTYIYKRTGKGIWRNLYEYPLIELEEAITVNQLLLRDDVKALWGKQNEVDSIAVICEDKKHLLSHQYLHANCLVVKLKTKETHTSAEEEFNETTSPLLAPEIPELKSLYGENLRCVPIDSVSDFPLHKLMTIFQEQQKSLKR